MPVRNYVSHVVTLVLRHHISRGESHPCRRTQTIVRLVQRRHLPNPAIQRIYTFLCEHAEHFCWL